MAGRFMHEVRASGPDLRDARGADDETVVAIHLFTLSPLWDISNSAWTLNQEFRRTLSSLGSLFGLSTFADNSHGRQS